MTSVHQTPVRKAGRGWERAKGDIASYGEGNAHVATRRCIRCGRTGICLPEILPPLTLDPDPTLVKES